MRHVPYDGACGDGGVAGEKVEIETLEMADTSCFQGLFCFLEANIFLSMSVF